MSLSRQRRIGRTTSEHCGNVLVSQREQWLVIDPKPYLGDPAYDGLQHMLNCDRLLTEPRPLAGRMAGLLDLDPQRVTEWLFARCVHESLDRPELARVAAGLRLVGMSRHRVPLLKRVRRSVAILASKL